MERHDLPNAQDTTPDLPEHFPALSVSVSLGKCLRRHSQVLNIDAAGIYEVLSQRDLSDQQIDSTTIVIDKASAAELFVGNGSTEAQHTYEAAHPQSTSVAKVNLSPLSIGRGTVSSGSMHLGHELVHVAERAGMNPTVIEESDKADVRTRLLMMSGGFVAGAAVQFRSVQDVLNADQFQQALHEAAGVLPGAFLGYSLGFLLAIRFVASERPAYRQQAGIHARYPDLLSLSRQGARGVR